MNQNEKKGLEELISKGFKFKFNSVNSEIVELIFSKNEHIVFNIEKNKRLLILSNLLSSLFYNITINI